ncbi:hypothetical protein [Mariprofundus ferrooxydans]|uniref:hypothetical protein n=1 Tax=Mariprofundus ferrooxydans TaxID=314344 RepID=UPI00142F8C67|nr:hypothetical protein [Mariprofundus ferrooxydans]
MADILMYIFGTILLTMLGNFLWEELFKSLIENIKLWMLNKYRKSKSVATSRVFRSVAHGHHESPSIFGLNLLIAMFCLLLIAPAGYFIPTILALNSESTINQDKFITLSEANHLIKKLKLDEQKDSKPIIAEKIKKLEDYRDELSEKLYIAIAIMCSLAFVITFRVLKIYFRMNLINLLITYQRQCLRVCRPFIDTRYALVIESQIARMTSEADYNEILDGFIQICISNSIKLPSPPEGLTFSVEFKNNIELS